MAYVALISLGQILEQILNLDEYLSMSLLEEQKVKDLRGNIAFIQIFLEEYSQNGGEAVHSLEIRIRDAAHKAEDIIESRISNQFVSEPTSPGAWRLLKQMISALTNMIPARHHNQDLQLVLREIDLIVEEVMMYMNSCRVYDWQRSAASPISSSQRADSSKVRMVGLDDDLIQIKARVCGESSKLETISIVGMGGIGLLGSIKMLDDGMDQESNTKLAERLHKCLKSRRLSEVAVYADSCRPIHQLRLLDQYQSWILLTEILFPGKSCPPQLENMGKKIAQSCRGLPLAICLVAGLLAEDKNRLDHWKNIGENIAENLNMAATRNEEQLSKIFSLSYNHLPHHLRACFLYLGVFPEDYEIRVSQLSKLWAAEGFLRSVSHKSFQQIADDCIEDLANRSLILVHKQKYNRRIKTCSLHDVLRDLCVRKAREEKFFDHVMERLLKVLDAARVYFDELPLELVHLRGPSLRPFIDAFCIPVEIWKMPQISHISVFYTSFLADPSSLNFDRRTPCLANLQTLSYITNFNFTKKAVRMMRKLKKLNVYYGAVTLERRSDYGLNNLVHLRKLEKLRFSSFSCNVPTPYLLPRSLKKLTLSDCRFPWQHTTIVGSLPNLEVLKLLWYGFCGREWQPVLGEFSQLKYLAIDTTDLECWLADSTNFPRLEHLRLENCSRLERIPSDIGEILTLKLIELRNCSSSAVDSAKEILEEQQNQGNESLQVRFYS
ncbi:UNVERIFIED_CONTAM: putative disease resistance protein [Sesamum calycinum]|uniref:Disease resistance protein n=1 Tax=Sesamum calycinum TaxID=2727403 RepID=A0AAW2NIP1_9LAMI